ncbi:MAG TPA: DUF1963 domain-containing protein [Arachnia sp.]|nr:DUF1963 domain-containing protein [Arachnia sp.]HMT85497.1 DUF1963 domain-containing protein [Arachnia sp.]
MSLREALATSQPGVLVLAMFDRVRELEARPTSPARMNRAVDAYREACAAYRSDRGRLAALRRLPVARSLDAEGEILLQDLLEPPVAELWQTPALLFEDNRVDIDPDDVSMNIAVFLIEDLFVFPDQDPELPDERYLSHFGGAPLAVPGTPPPPEPLVVQLDLRQLDSSLDADLRGLLEIEKLPPGGVLQVFADGMSDSWTAPERRGGGVSLRYLTEQEVAAAVAVEREADVFERVFVAYEVGPAFSARPGASSDVIDRVAALEQAAHRAVALSYPTREQLERAESAVLAALPSRRVSFLLGSSPIDYIPEQPDRDLLELRLPLRGPDDGHLLLLSLAGVGALVEVFGIGDDGWLQVWMRRSDLAAARFDDIVSFIRSG